jgi:hypothetical protein
LDPLLSFVPLLTFAAMVIFWGTIIGAIAKRKHRNTWLWKATGAFGFLFALVAILCFRDLNSLSIEDQNRSRLKEKIIFVVVIVMWAVSLLMYFQAPE